MNCFHAAFETIQEMHFHKCNEFGQVHTLVGAGSSGGDCASSAWENSRDIKTKSIFKEHCHIVFNF